MKTPRTPTRTPLHSHRTSTFFLNPLPKTLIKIHSPSPKPSSLQISCSSQPKNPQTLTSLFTLLTDWPDQIKESRMQQKRSLYNHEKWLEHRSSSRHIRHLLSSLSSRVILSLIPPVLAFTSVAAFVAGYNSAVSLHWLPGFLPLLRASSLPYQLTAPALALLLVFRTEASYSRFEEGRKAWMRVIAGTGELARQVMAAAEHPGDEGMKKAVLQYIIAFPVALKCHVIYGSDIAKDLQNLLEEDDLAIVLSSKHHPHCIIEFISQGLRFLHMDDTKRNALESKIGCFDEGIGVCEQLMGIPIPLSYTRLTSRFLVLWHLTLPIILWEDCNWIVVPATFISAASLFCIEEVGVLIEEPFTMLALDELCDLAHQSIREAIAIENLIQGRLQAKSKRSHSKPNSSECSPNGKPNS